MALLGLLSVLQIVALPGHLLLRAFRLGTGILGTCVLSFALSLVANHLLVAGLVVLGIYRPAVVYAVFAAELLLLLRIDGRWLRAGLADAVIAGRQHSRAFLCDLERDCPIRSRGLRRTLIGIALALIGAFALSGILEAGQIFQQWDAVVSWNRWAIDWAANRLPRVTSIYPQLLPTNISLTYLFMRSSEVWIFAKGFQFLFCLMLLLAMLDLGRLRGFFGLVPGVVITYGLLVALLRFRMLSSGYADVPLAFFAFMVIYALMLASRAADRGMRMRYLVVGAVLAAGAALTKQTGLYVAAVYPLLAWRFVLRDNQGAVSGARRLATIGGLCLILGVLVAPWYLYKFADFHAGHDQNNTALLVSNFHEGRSLPARMVHGGMIVGEATTPLGGAMLLIALAASLRDPLSRWLLGLFVVPLGLLWAAAFSYDLRNLAILLPFVGAAAGIGLTRIVAWAEAIARSSGDNTTRPVRIEKTAPYEGSTSLGMRRAWFQSIRVGHLAGLLLVLLIAASLGIRDDALLALQRRQQTQVGIPSLNRQVYAYSDAHPDMPVIASDYLAMRWLPDMGPRSVGCTCHELSAFRQTFDRPDIRCVLVRTPGAAAEVREFLARQSIARLVFEDHGYAFYEKPSRGQVAEVTSRVLERRPIGTK